MKKLVYSLGILLFLIVIIIACEKQDDPEPSNTAMNPQAMMTICHLDGDGNWVVMEIDEEDWPDHEAHGDMFWQDFPTVGIYKWVTVIDSVEHLNTMYITEITETTFTGYGKDHAENMDWDIVDGTINSDYSFSFTIDYVGSGDYLDCTGSFECGLGITGTADGTESGTWTAFFGGGFSEGSDAVEVDP